MSWYWVLLIVYACSYLTLILEGVGTGLLAYKLDVDFEEAYMRVVEHAPFGVIKTNQIHWLILDLLFAEPVLGHFMMGVLVCEIYKLHMENQSKES